MFILFDEQHAIMEFAKRGLNKYIPCGVVTTARDPMVGWECTNCGKVFKIDHQEFTGDCENCFSPLLDPIFGETLFLKKHSERKKRMREIRLQQRKL